MDGAADTMLIYDANASQLKKTTRNVLLNVTSQPIGLTDTQSPTNKTFDNTNIFTIRDDRLTLQDNADTTKQAVFQLSGITTGTTRTYTLPNASSTLMDLASAQTITGVKTFGSPVLNTPSIVNPTITVDTISEYTAANGVNIDGVKLKDGALATNNSVVTANITDAAVTPAKLLAGTGSSWTWQAYVPTWTNLTVGNGTVTARYSQTGKTIVCQVKIVFGTTTAVSGGVTVTTPTTISSNYDYASILGQGFYLDTGTAAYAGVAIFNNTTTIELDILGTGSTYATAAALSSTVPFTWGNGDKLFFSIVYEAA